MRGTAVDDLDDAVPDVGQVAADILFAGKACNWMAARHVELLTCAQLLTRLAASQSRRERVETSSCCQKCAMFVAPFRRVT